MQVALRKAAEIHEGMGYMEPPRQFQPVKHCLGWVLLQLGRPVVATEVTSLGHDAAVLPRRLCMTACPCLPPPTRA